MLSLSVCPTYCVVNQKNMMLLRFVFNKLQKQLSLVCLEYVGADSQQTLLRAYVGLFLNKFIISELFEKL